MTFNISAFYGKKSKLTEMKPELHKKPRIAHGWLRALIFIIFYMALLVAAGMVFYMVNKKTAGPDTIAASKGSLLYVSFIINALISVIAVWLFRTFIDRRSVESLGLGIQQQGMHAGAGFFTGIFLVCAGTCLLYFTKNLQWTGMAFNGNDLFIGFGLMVIVAFYEEFVFRGYLLNNLLESVNKWAALFIAALVFALAHATNPGLTAVAAINILLAGLLLGINYLYTRHLWFSLMLHFAWNFFQGPVLGYDVSGIQLQSVFQHEVSGSTLLTGGTFGFEGSLLCTVLLVVASTVLVLVYEKKYKPLPAENGGPAAAVYPV
jgi:uncharacterized protein